MDDDLPTLRLVTLRRLLPRHGRTLAFELATPVAQVAAALGGSAAIAAVVDGTGILQGTVALADLCDCDPACPIGAVMQRDASVLQAELELEQAWSLVRDDRVLVVDADGRLLGILTRRDLAAAKWPAPPVDASGPKRAKLTHG
jgi:CBS domain-containing protein